MLSLHFNSAMPKQQKINKEPKEKTYRNTYAIVNVNFLNLEIILSLIAIIDNSKFCHNTYLTYS